MAVVVGARRCQALGERRTSAGRAAASSEDASRGKCIPSSSLASGGGREGGCWRRASWWQTWRSWRRQSSRSFSPGTSKRFMKPRIRGGEKGDVPWYARRENLLRLVLVGRLNLILCIPYTMIHMSVTGEWILYVRMHIHESYLNHAAVSLPPTPENPVMPAWCQ